MKIWHYGILSTRNKTKCIQAVRNYLNVAPAAPPVKGQTWMEIFEMLYERNPKLCPCCGKGVLLIVTTFLPKYLIKIRSDPDILPNIEFHKQLSII